MPRPPTLAAESPDQQIENWVRHHQNGAFRHLRFLGCEVNLAEDLLQTALLAAVQSGIHERPNALAARWLRSTVRNLFFSSLRTTRNRPPTQSLTDEAAVEAAFTRVHGPDSATGDLFASALKACLEQLSPRSRDGLTRFYAEDASRDDVARELGMSVEGVKTLLRRAKDALRDCIGHKKETWK